VYRENTYTSATIEVAANQKVIESGPYTLVRHPMYASALLYLLGTLSRSAHIGDCFPSRRDSIPDLAALWTRRRCLRENLTATHNISSEFGIDLYRESGERRESSSTDWADYADS